MILAVDCALSHPQKGFAAIAVCEVPSERLLGSEIVEADNSNLAEAFAVIRACQFLAGRKVEGVIWTDSLTVVRVVEGKRRGGLGEVGIDLRAMLAINHLTLEWKEAGDVKAAHNAARQVNKAFEAGRGGKATWKRSRPYVRIPEMVAES